MSEEMQLETRIALEDNALESGLMRVGQPSPWTCPECHGVLLQLKTGGILRFRCHTGHAFSAPSLLATLHESIDDALWNTLRALEESVMLRQHVAEHLRQEGHDLPTADRYTQQVAQTRQQSEAVRQLVMQRPRYPAPPQEKAPDAGDVAP